jgi:multiple sugar transport system permease protein
MHKNYFNFALIILAAVTLHFIIFLNPAGAGGPAGVLTETAGEALKAPGGEKIKISVWDFPRITLPKKANDRFLWLREICDEFERLNPEVRVDITKLTWNQGGEKIKIAVFAGVPPDISSSDLPLKYIENGLIEPVDDYITGEDKTDYFQSALDSFKINGKTYGFAWAQKTDYIYLNKALFQKAGVALPENGMWSLAEFRDKMKKISAALNIKPFAFSVEREQTSELPFLFMYGGGYLNFKDSSGGVKLLHDFIYADKISPIETGGLKTRDNWLDFKEKQIVAAAPFGIWAMPALKKDPKIEFDIAQYPYIDETARGREGEINGGAKPLPRLSFSSVIGYYVFRQKEPVKRDYCIKLARFITGSQNQKVIKYYGQFPTRKSAAMVYDDDPLMKKAFALFEYARPALVHDDLARIDEHIKSACQKILLNGSMSAEEIGGRVLEISSYISGLTAGANKSPARGAASSDNEKGEAASKVNRDDYIFKTRLFNFISFILFIAAAAYLLYYKKLPGDFIKNRWAYFFMAPAAAVFIVFFILPVIRGVLISFQNYSFGCGWFDNFCGLSNYVYALNDKVFLKSALNTFLYAAIVVPSNIAIALILSVLIYRLSERAQTWFKGAFYLPGVVSIVTLSIVWRYIFDFKSGVLNALLAQFGAGPVGWLTTEEMSLYSIIIFTILKGPGGALLIYLTALCNIPKDYFEAASVDGAGPVKTFVKITFPLLMPQTMFLAISLTIDAMQVFAPVMLLTEGGPANSSEVVMHRVYKEAFNNLNMGAASAMSVLLFMVILAASVLQYKYFKYDY